MRSNAALRGAGVRVLPRVAQLRARGRVLLTPEQSGGEGQEEEVDVVLLCTGYEHEYPFLPPGVVDVSRQGAGPLFQHCLHAGLPSLAVIGVPYQVIPFRLAEEQARWVAALWADHGPCGGHTATATGKNAAIEHGSQGGGVVAEAPPLLTGPSLRGGRRRAPPLPPTADMCRHAIDKRLRVSGGVRGSGSVKAEHRLAEAQWAYARALCALSGWGGGACLGTTVAGVEAAVAAAEAAEAATHHCTAGGGDHGGEDAQFVLPPLNKQHNDDNEEFLQEEEDYSMVSPGWVRAAYEATGFARARGSDYRATVYRVNEDGFLTVVVDGDSIMSSQQ